MSSIVRTKDGLPVLGLAHLLVFAQEIGALSADVVAVSREIAQQAGAGEADADTPHPPQSSLAVTFQSRTGTTEAEPPPSQPEPVRHDPVDSWAAYDQSEANSREERGS